MLASVRRNVGMLFQGNALFDFMNVHENIAMVLQEIGKIERSDINRQVKDMLESLNLGDIGRKMPSELSGGMKKRVALARALIAKPKIFFCDAPTAGLDPITSDTIAELILDMSRKLGLTMLLVTNEMPIVRKLADRVALLTHGKIVDLGPPGDLSASDNPEARKFIEKEFAT
jgi:phospholipid/cholesterol/gamma-HCH transport system ATP-binding protein